VPAGHPKQAVLPTMGATNPVAQAVQLEPGDGAALPMAHRAHAVRLAVTWVPAGHTAHAICPSSGWYWPAGQGRHAKSMPGE
jgi:hypothetical protein